VVCFQQIKLLSEKGLKYTGLSPNMEIRSASRRRKFITHRWVPAAAIRARIRESQATPLQFRWLKSFQHRFLEKLVCERSANRLDNQPR
jgi:hypothetical protein